MLLSTLTLKDFVKKVVLSY